jgi:hypothetical protein
MITDTNGNTYSQAVRKESDGTYSKIVCFGPRDYASTVCRNYYKTYKEAQYADISDDNVIAIGTAVPDGHAYAD